ncbi:TIM barrel protein [Devosia rhodophyticola]|uniref:TIM barrel protein n=1 Tax=Devosia rhodophyticola TaxID=3026423 RepID=A0ABY7Z1G7_9HYPH|nr:TIM barrel protein [Devosia rhodophyticola]WDR07402.1 TIM barrel protein [Devosia rhodophyticola]
MRFSACIEMLFAPETEIFAERIGLAAAAGLEVFEFWRWTNKDIDAIEMAMRTHDMTLAGLVAEPMVPLTDPDQHDAFLSGLVQSVAVAQRLGAKVLIAQAGDDLPGRSRPQQRAAIEACLLRAADVLKGTGVTLALEPLNTLIDHKGYFLASTIEGLDIIDNVGRAEIGLLYDLYHSMVMGEKTAEVLEGRVDRIAHIHVADHLGRNQPGTGQLPLAAALKWLFANGYKGCVGLEYRPIGPTAAALAQTRRELEV